LRMSRAKSLPSPSGSMTSSRMRSGVRRPNAERASAIVAATSASNPSRSRCSASVPRWPLRPRPRGSSASRHDGTCRCRRRVLSVLVRVRTTPLGWRQRLRGVRCPPQPLGQPTSFPIVPGTRGTRRYRSSSSSLVRLSWPLGSLAWTMAGPGGRRSHRLGMGRVAWPQWRWSGWRRCRRHAVHSLDWTFLSSWRPASCLARLLEPPLASSGHADLREFRGEIFIPPRHLQPSPGCPERDACSRQCLR